MKKFLIIIGCIALFIALIVLVAMQATKGLPIAADAFFAKLAAGEVTEAYVSTSEAFRKGSTLEEFQLYVERMGLANHRGAS